MQKLIVKTDEWEQANKLFPGMFNDLGKAIFFLNQTPEIRNDIITKLEAFGENGIYISIDPASTAVLSNDERVRIFGEHEELTDVMFDIARIKGMNSSIKLGK